MEKRFGVVSADGHCRLMHLPFDLWSKRLPRKFQDDAPRVVTGADGVRQWVVEGRPWSGVGWAGVGRGPVNCYTRAGLPEEPEPGIFRAANARYRCEDMDRDGVDAELVNGPYEQIWQIKNPELRTACVRAVNDWARELYEESNGRFIMLLPLPCMAPDEAVAELLRVADFGMPTGVIFDWANAPRTGNPSDVGASLGGGRGDGNAGQSARQSKWRVAPNGGWRVGYRAAQSGIDAGRQLPDGADGRIDECRRVLRYLRSASRYPLCPRRGGGRVGPVHVLAI